MTKSHTFNVTKLEANKYQIESEGYMARTVVVSPLESLQSQMEYHLKLYYTEVVGSQ